MTHLTATGLRSPWENPRVVHQYAAKTHLTVEVEIMNDPRQLNFKTRLCLSIIMGNKEMVSAYISTSKGF